MRYGVDYSYARPDPAVLLAAGKTFAGRYVVGPLRRSDGTLNPKLLTAAEVQALHGGGIDIFLLAEYGASSALAGRSLGVSHAQEAQARLAVIGAPLDSVLYTAVDFDCLFTQWPTVRDYLAGFASVVGLSRTGVYGGIRVMQWAARDQAASWFFQTYAWSAGQWFGYNHIEQYHNGANIDGDVDLCRAVQANFGQWPSQPEVDIMTAAEFLAILQDPAVAAQMRRLPWQYIGGGIPAGMSTLGVLNDTHIYAKAAASALPADLAVKLDAILAAALDDGDTTMILPPDAIADLQALKTALEAVPDAVADELADRVAE